MDVSQMTDEALVEKFSDSSYCKIEGWGDDSGYEPERTELLNRLRARSVEGLIAKIIDVNLATAPSAEIGIGMEMGLTHAVAIIREWAGTSMNTEGMDHETSLRIYQNLSDIIEETANFANDALVLAQTKKRDFTLSPAERQYWQGKADALRAIHAMLDPDSVWQSDPKTIFAHKRDMAMLASMKQDGTQINGH